MKNAESVTFGASSLDRASHLRGNMAALLQNKDADAILYWRGRILADLTDFGLKRLPLDHIMLKNCSEPIFLGNCKRGPLFAYDVSTWEPDPTQSEIDAGFLDQSAQIHPQAPTGSAFQDVRAIMAHLTRDDAEIAAAAKGVFGWHKAHQFCANCGEATHMADAGWQRQCPKCHTPHFPRTDPVVIMLITHGNKVLLGRSPSWPEKMYSLLAGFMEPGETVEAAVRREVFEESHVKVGEVEYMTSQPWPFPSSIMLGFIADASSDDIQVDKHEIDDARWFSRTELQSFGDWGDDTPGLKVPRVDSISRYLIEHWVSLGD